MTNRAFVRRCMPIRLSQFAVLQLTVYEFEIGSAILGDGSKPFEDGLTRSLRAGLRSFDRQDESSIERGLVYRRR